MGNIKTLVEDPLLRDFIEGGYKRGNNASVFYHPQHDVRVMVHGDDD